MVFIDCRLFWISINVRIGSKYKTKQHIVITEDGDNNPILIRKVKDTPFSGGDIVSCDYTASRFFQSQTIPESFYERFKIESL